MMENLRKGCGLGVPHGEHTWECEDWGRVRCPGRDTGDTTGLNAKPCGKTRPHPGHLWDKADATEVFRCFGALGPKPVADVEVNLFSDSGELLGGGRTDDDGWINLDEVIQREGPGMGIWVQPGFARLNGCTYQVDNSGVREFRKIGTTDDGDKVHASPLEEGRMGKSKKDYTRGEFLEEYGSKFSRCELPEPHPGHAWLNNREAFPGGGGGWWWCGGEALREAPHDAPDPFLPHKPCERETPHKPHDWVWDDRPMTRYHCDGRTFDPEATLHEGNQPGDFILDLSPNIPDSLRPTDTLPDRSLPEPTDTLHAGNQTPEVERVFEEIRETRRREREEAQGWDPSQGDGTPEGLPSPEEAMEILRAKAEENRSLPVRWADRAMFKAEPIKAEEGPKVYLLWMTPDPLGAIAAACKMYKGEVVRDLSTITDDERMEYLAQVNRTKLKAPFEFVQFHFMIEGVTRSFTHQMVRQRTAAYAQESLRFAVVTGEGQDMPVALPPSLSGLDENDPARLEWENALGMVEGAYDNLVNMYGVPAEDARGLLPHNIMTRLNYTTNLRALLDHAGNRLCTQAQFEWRLVFAKIVEAIRDAENHAAGPVDIVGSPGYVKMARELTSLFKPVCYQTGKCEFKANFDRACSIRDRVDAFAAQGVPPERWEEGNGLSGAEKVPGIKPGEWLLDPKAARRK